jgi:hypothetical protein
VTDDERRYPRWLRIVLVAVHVVAVAGGILIGNATYQAWSEPDVEPAPTTTTVAPAVPVPVD